MKKLIALCLALVANLCFAFDPLKAGMTLVFNDDFTTISSDWETQWWYDTKDVCQNTYAPLASIATNDGLRMHIQSLETMAVCAGKHAYSDAHMDAFRGHVSIAGPSYWEARVKASTAPGTLTAWWLLPSNGAWPPEVDAVEVRGDRASLGWMTNHWLTPGVDPAQLIPTQQQAIYTNAEALGVSFHTYGVMLATDTQEIIWYLDGVERARMPLKTSESAGMFPVLTFYTGRCGDGWAGCPEGSGPPLKGWSADAYVRWVRIWTKPGVSHAAR